MSFYDLIAMSLGNLWRRKLRTFLTVLGVLIGTTSIVAMLSLAFGMKQMIMEEYSSMGAITQIQVSSDSGMEGGSASDLSTMLTDSNIEMFEGMEYVQRVMPRLSMSVDIKCGRYNSSTTLCGVDRSVLESQEIGEGQIPGKSGAGLQLIAGNQILTNMGYMRGEEYVDYYTTGELPDIDLMKQVRQLQIYYDSAEYEESAADVDIEGDDGTEEDGSETADSESDAGMDSNIKVLRVDITGILEGSPEEYKEYSYNLLADIDTLKSILLRYFGRGHIPGQPRQNGRPLSEWVYTDLVMEVDEADHVDSVQQDIRDLGFYAQSNKELLESAQKNLQIIELVLGGIGMVAFLVAAIGIANTMMMSTYERTKEIGIMKVLGCDMRDIQKLFLVEAGFIGLIGGFVGLGLTWVVSTVINHVVQSTGEMSGDISVIPWWLAVAAVVFSTCMGMVAGYFPARRAMMLSPLAAIRTE